MRFLKTIVVAALSFIIAAPAIAQRADNIPLGYVLSPTVRVPGTYHSDPRTNTGSDGVLCTFTQTAEPGNPSTTFSVDFFDSASSTWQAIATSGAITNASSQNGVRIMIYPGVQATSVPTGMVIAGLKVPRTWRITEIITGGTSTNGGVGCDSLN